jgi:hypothetical protein
MVGSNRFKRRYNTINKLQQLKEGMLIHNQQTGKTVWQEIKAHDICNIYTANKTSLFFNLKPNKGLTFHKHFCPGGTKSKRWVTVLYVSNMDRNFTLNLRRFLPKCKYKFHYILIPILDKR